MYEHLVTLKFNQTLDSEKERNYWMCYLPSKLRFQDMLS